MDPKYASIDPTHLPPVGLADLRHEMRHAFGPYPWHVVLVIGWSLAFAVADLLFLALVYPFLNAVIDVRLDLPIDLAVLNDAMEIFNAADTKTKFQFIAAMMLVAVILRSFVEYQSRFVTARLYHRLETDYRSDFMALVLGLDYAFVSRYKNGQVFALLSNFTVHASRIANSLLQSIAPLLLLLVYTLAILAISVPLTLLAVGTAAASAYVVHRFSHRIRTLAEREAGLFLALNQMGYEFISGLRMIKSFGRERAIHERYHEAVVQSQDVARRKTVIQAGMKVIAANIASLTLAIIILAATFLLAVEGAKWVAAILLYIAVMGRVAAPMQQLNAIRGDLAADLPPFRCLIGFRKLARPFLRPDEGRVVDGIGGDIRFMDVTFRYAAHMEPVLDRLNLDIPHGRTTALVGASGSGKSTIANLLAGVYRPTAGRIVVDGHDLAGYRMSSWQEVVGVVSQDIFLLNDSVMRNIRFARPDATDEQCIAAAKAANAHDFIMALEEGYDTEIGDRGLRLSGGQAQRLALARVFVKDTQLLILDEATSALDAESEQLIHEAIERASIGRTVLVIAHRLATVRRADLIYVLENGAVVEKGTHGELLAKGGQYFNYIQLQSLGT